jgi:predicted ArsR family transcriptional regulator
MKPENERTAALVEALLCKDPLTIDDLAEHLRLNRDSVKYVVTQLVRKDRIVKLENKRYGHPHRLNASTPPLFLISES